MVKVREDMTGWKMWEHGVPDSRLIVTLQIEDYISPSGRHQARYLCKCKCGNNKDVIATAGDIKGGNTLSCGCLQKEKVSLLGKSKKKENLYDLSGDYGVGWTCNTNKEFYFDLEDYDKIKDYCWRECVDQTNYHYLVARKRGNRNKAVRMTDIIIGKYYDHKNRNTFDNRKSNLRKATFSQNARNKSVQKNNTSGVTGVSYDKNCSRWRAYIQDNNQRKYVGCFSNKEDAIIARLKAEKERYGEFAPQKYLFEQYKINVEESDL